MKRAATALVLLGACGRASFDPLADGGNGSDGSDASGDGALDAPGFVSIGVSDLGAVATNSVVLTDVRVGDLIVISRGWSSDAGFRAGTVDTIDTTYASTNPFSGSQSAVNWSIGVATKAADSVMISQTLDGTPDSFHEMRALLFRGMQPVANYDGICQVEGAAIGADAASCSLTTTFDGDLFVGYLLNLGGAGSAGTGNTAVTTSSLDPNFVGVAGSPGSHDVFASASSGTWVMSVLGLQIQTN